jgi:hypothetical protein
VLLGPKSGYLQRDEPTLSVDLGGGSARILEAIAAELGVEHCVVSEWGLREGALLAASAEHVHTG